MITLEELTQFSVEIKNNLDKVSESKKMFVFAKMNKLIEEFEKRNQNGCQSKEE